MYYKNKRKGAILSFWFLVSSLKTIDFLIWEKVLFRIKYFYPAANCGYFLFLALGCALNFGLILLCSSNHFLCFKNSSEGPPFSS